MSVYAEKYKLEWIDYFGQEAQLLIDEQATEGTYTDIKGTRSPITLTYDTPSDFLLEPINGSMMTIRLIAQTDFQFSELYTANNRKYRATLNIDSSLFWQGYLLPDQYKEEYKGPPYVNEFIAADQLGYLKTLSWSNTSTLNDKEALEIIFAATDLELDMQEGLNIYEQNYSSTAADSPLDQTYFDAEVFTDKTYYDALYHILFKYNAVLKQRAGEWFIYRPREATAAYTLRKWTYSAGVYTYDSNQSYDPVVLTTSATTAEASLVRITPGGTMFIQPAWKSYTLTQNLRLLEAFNENHDFTQWTGVNPDGWSKYGTPTYGKSGNKLVIYSSGATAQFYQELNIRNAAVTKQVFKLRFEYDVYIPPGYDLDVYFSFRDQSMSPPYDYYDPATQAWVSTPKYMYATHDNTGGSYAMKSSESMEFITPDIINPGTYDIRVQTPQSSTTDAYIAVDKISCSILSYVSSVEVTDFNEEVDYSDDMDADNNYVPGDMEMLVGDIPVSSSPNADNIWKGTLFRDAGKSIDTYTWDADDRSGTLAALMQNNFTDLFQYPQQVLSVKLYTKLIDSCTIIREINNTTDENKYFMIKRASWEAQAGYWEVEAHQLPFAVGVSRILLETGDKILLETGDEIIRE